STARAERGRPTGSCTGRRCTGTGEESEGGADGAVVGEGGRRAGRLGWVAGWVGGGCGRGGRGGERGEPPDSLPDGYPAAMSRFCHGTVLMPPGWNPGGRGSPLRSRTSLTPCTARTKWITRIVRIWSSP